MYCLIMTCMIIHSRIRIFIFCHWCSKKNVLNVKGDVSNVMGRDGGVTMDFYSGKISGTGDKTVIIIDIIAPVHRTLLVFHFLYDL